MLTYAALMYWNSPPDLLIIVPSSANDNAPEVKPV